jgi:hypothetical protein
MLIKNYKCRKGCRRYFGTKNARSAHEQWHRKDIINKQTKKHKRDEVFWGKLTNLSSNKSIPVYEWHLYNIRRIFFNERKKCICGRKIKNEEYRIKNVETWNRAVVGSCCIRKIGIHLKWRNKCEYLISAVVYSRNEWERKFIKSLIRKAFKWGNRVIISNKQKNILEKITGKKWKWETWNHKICESL